jgi:hypothetical protein
MDFYYVHGYEQTFWRMDTVVKPHRFEWIQPATIFAAGPEAVGART